MSRNTTPAAWHARAGELATWANRYFVRTDRCGAYKSTPDGTRPYTAPAPGPEPGWVSDARLVAHFRAAGTGDVIGAHCLAPGKGGRWAAVDVDAHPGTPADPVANEAFALAIDAEVRRLGMTPLTYESNGAGGFHVVVFFAGEDPWVPGEVLFDFGRWLARNFSAFGFAKPPETFPKAPVVKTDKYGTWLRLVGRHHTRDAWPRV